MRLGDGSLLLNVNVTTSAFFPSINLQDWIKRRWIENIPPKKSRHELIGVGVTYRGDLAIRKGLTPFGGLEIYQLVLSSKNLRKTGKPATKFSGDGH